MRALATEMPTLKYRAFLSYSHRDTAWAKWLHRALEAYRIDKDLVGRETAHGLVPKTLRPIFRDRDDFSDASKIRHVLRKMDWTTQKHERPQVDTILARQHGYAPAVAVRDLAQDRASGTGRRSRQAPGRL